MVTFITWWLVINVGCFLAWIGYHTSQGSTPNIKYRGKPATPIQAALLITFFAIFWIPFAIKTLFWD